MWASTILHGETATKLCAYLWTEQFHLDITTKLQIETYDHHNAKKPHHYGHTILKIALNSLFFLICYVSGVSLK